MSLVPGNSLTFATRGMFELGHSAPAASSDTSMMSPIIESLGETITYYPGESETINGGDIVAFATWGIFTVASGREIEAIVERGASAPVGSSRAPGASITVTVANDSATGIAASEIDTGLDTISIAIRAGGTVSNHRIVKVATSDSGIGDDCGSVTLELG